MTDTIEEPDDFGLVIEPDEDIEPWFREGFSPVLPKVSTLTEETETHLTFHFVCQGCDAEGDLQLEKKDGMKSFGCPEGCGATYVPWKYLGGWRLTCVVCPFRGGL